MKRNLIVLFFALLGTFISSLGVYAYTVSINGTAYSTSGTISNDAITSGTVTWDATNGVLTLNNATLTASGTSHVIETTSSGYPATFTVSLVGTNRVSHTGAATNWKGPLSAYTGTNLTITGPESSSLSLTSNYIAVLARDNTFTIKGGCSVTANGGYNNNDGYSDLRVGSLVVNASDLTINPNSGANPGNLKSVTLTDCRLVSPSGTTLSASSNKFTVDGATVANGTRIVIEKTKGSLGNNCFWNFNVETGTLTISGTGAMPNYSARSSQWYSNDEVRSIVIEEGITSIGTYTFAYESNLTTVTLPSTLTSIGSNAFASSNSISTIYANSTPTFGSNAFTNYNPTVYASDTDVANAFRQLFYNVIDMSAMFTIYLRVTDEGTPLNLLEYEWTSVSVYDENGVWLGNSAQTGSQTAPLKVQLSPNNAASLEGKTLTFRLNVRAPQNEDPTITDGFYYINPDGVLLNNAVTTVKYTQGGEAGSISNPITLNYVALKSLSLPTTVSLKVGETINTDDLLTITPSNASLPIDYIYFNTPASNPYVAYLNYGKSLSLTGTSSTSSLSASNLPVCSWYSSSLNVSGEFKVSVTEDPNSCVYFLNIVSNGEPLEEGSLGAEQEVISVQPYINGVAYGEPLSALSYVTPGATSGYPSYYYALNVPSNTYSGKTVEFHVIPHYIVDLLGETGGNSLPLTGEYIVNTISYNNYTSNSQIPVKAGTVYGSITNPVLLNYKNLNGVYLNSSVEVAVGKSVDLNNYYTIEPSDASMPVDFDVDWWISDEGYATLSGSTLKGVKATPGEESAWGSFEYSGGEGEISGGGEFPYVVTDPNMMTVWFEITDEGAIFESSEYVYLEVSAFADGDSLGVSTYEYIWDQNQQLLPRLRLSFVPKNPSALTGKELTFHLITSAASAFEGSRETATIETDGAYIIHPSCVTLSGQTTKITYQPGKTWGTPEVPVVLDYVNLNSVSVTNPIELQVGQTVVLNDYVNYSPTNASVPVNFGVNWSWTQDERYTIGESADGETTLTGNNVIPYPGEKISWNAQYQYYGNTQIVISDPNNCSYILLIMADGEPLNSASWGLSEMDFITVTPYIGGKAVGEPQSVKTYYENRVYYFYYVISIPGSYAGKTVEFHVTTDYNSETVYEIESNSLPLSGEYIIRDVWLRNEANGTNYTASTMPVTKGKEWGTMMNPVVLNYVTPTSISTTPASLSMTVGDTYNLNNVTYTFNPATSSVPVSFNPEWTVGNYVNNLKIQKNNSGTILTALQATTNPISIEAYSDNYSVSLPVTISEKVIAVTGITIADANNNQVVWLGDNWMDAYLPLDDLYTIAPSNATNQEVTWTSSNESVAEINSGGNEFGEWYAVGKKVGTTTLTVKTADGGKTATLTLEVRAHVTGIELKNNSVTVKRGSTTNLANYIKNVLPTDAYDKSVTWAVTDTATVVSVGQNLFGVWQMVANRAGTTTLQVTSVDNPQVVAFLTVTVESSVTGVTVAEPSQIVYIGETVNLSYTIQPSDATNKAVTWKSSDDSVVKVTETPNGAAPYSAVAQKVGTATLTITTSDGGKTATISVEVRAHVESITLKSQSVTINRGSTVDLSNYIQSVLPADAYDKSVTWAVTDTATVVTVGQTQFGVWQMKANRVGTTTLRVTSVDNPQVVAFLTVTVESKVTGITVEEPDQILYIGEYANLNYTIQPSDASNKEVTWKSSNESVVKLEPTPTGYSAIAQKVGAATLTVTTVEGGKKASIKIEVRAHVESITLNTQRITVNRGNTVNLTQYIASILPDNAYDKSVKWTSGDPSIVSISGSTAVANAIGTCRVTVASVDNPRATATMEIVVEAAAAGIYATKPVQTVWIGEEVDLSYYFEPADATSTIKSWTSSNPSVVAISGGTTTAYRAVAQKSGTAVLTVTTDNGQTATIQVTVHAHVTGIELTAQQITVNRGTTTDLAQYIKAILPTDAYDKSVAWAVTDTATVVTVSQKNDAWQMKANRVGTTTLRVVSVDNPQVAAFLSVIVESVVTGITVEEPNQILYIGEYANLNYTIQPSDATNKAVTWKSSDNSIVKVEPTPTGYSAVAQKVGTATLTVTTADGGKTATIVINTRAHVESITLTTQSITINRGSTVNLTQYIKSVLPENAYDKSVTWTSGDPSIVSINGSTAVANAIGTCRLTVASVDNPQATAVLEVTVEAAADGINVDNPVQTVWVGDDVDLGYYFVPADATSNIKSWTSSDPSVVAISGDGTTTAYRAVAQKSGTAVLTVTTDNGQTATIQVTVYAHVEAIRLTVRSVRVNRGTTTGLDQYIDVILPEDAHNKSVTWAVTDTATVVSVSQSNNGWQMTANRVGQTTLQVTSVDNPQVQAFLMVTVESVSEGITAEEPEQTIWIGESVNLGIVFDRPDATTTISSWTSSNPDVVSVKETDNGYEAVGVAAGEATLTVTTDNGLKTTISVTVHAHVDDMTAEIQEITIQQGETVSLDGYLSFEPENAYNKNVVWTSRDGSVVSVSGSGTHWTATGVKAGSTTLMAVSEDNPDLVIAIEIQVTAVSEGIIVANPKQRLPIHSTVDLSYTLIPEDATQKVSWSSSNPDVVAIEVGSDGTINAYCNQKGTAVLTVTTEDGHSATIEVEVYTIIERISLGNNAIIRLAEGDSLSLSDYIASGLVEIYPEDADDKRLSWTNTADEAVAKSVIVGEERYLVGVAKGQTSMAIYAVANTDVYARIQVIVSAEVASFKVNNPEQTVMAGDEIDLSYTILPESASDCLVTWTCADPDAFTFTSDGRETICRAAKMGTFYLVGTPDGVHYDSIRVTATRPELEGIRVEYNGDGIMKGDTLVATLTPIPEHAPIDASKLTYRLDPEVEGGWRLADVTMEVISEEEIHLIAATHTWGYYTIVLSYPGMEGNGDATTGAGKKQIQDIYFNVGQRVKLEQGWNWVTLAPTSVYQGQINAVAACFDNKLLDGRTQKDLIYYDPEFGYFGTLYSLSGDCYKLNVSEAVEYKRTNVSYSALQGYGAQLKKGWNWIEYPYDVDYTFDELRAAGALGSPTYADRIVSKDGGFAEWTGYTWFGDLKELKEDEGYMYYTSTDQSLTWPSVTKLDQKLDKASGAPGRRTLVGEERVWQYNHRRFADNMTIVADVKGMAFPDDCSIGAFVGDECRGEGRYVDGHFFITVHGKIGETITFILHDDATDTYYTIPGTMNFDLMAGSLQHPVPFKVGEKTTDIDWIGKEDDGDADVYDLVGRRVVSPATGFYIKDGKKIFQK